MDRKTCFIVLAIGIYEMKWVGQISWYTLCWYDLKIVGVLIKYDFGCFKIWELIMFSRRQNEFESK